MIVGFKNMPLLKNIIFSLTILFSSIVESGWLPSIPKVDLFEAITNPKSLIPEPYKIPITQGTLIPEENISRLQVGLSKEQVKFLLGSPSFIDTFHINRWDYIYSTRDDNNTKKIAIIFVNEKVREIIIGSDPLIAKESLSKDEY